MPLRILSSVRGYWTSTSFACFSTTARIRRRARRLERSERIRQVLPRGRAIKPASQTPSQELSEPCIRWQDSMARAMYIAFKGQEPNTKPNRRTSDDPLRFVRRWDHEYAAEKSFWRSVAAIMHHAVSGNAILKDTAVRAWGTLNLGNVLQPAIFLGHQKAAFFRKRDKQHPSNRLAHMHSTRIRGLDTIFGGWWHMQPMKPARYEELREIHDARLQAAAFAWTGGLGVWALDNADANFLKYFQRILDRLHDAGYVPGHTQSSFSSQRATRSPSPQRRGVPGTFLQLLQLPERAWVERFRSVVRVCGVGEDQGQARARHVELMNACLPEWDFRWQKNVSAAGKVFHRAGASSLPPRNSDGSVMTTLQKQRLLIWLKRQVHHLQRGTLSTDRVRSLVQALGTQWMTAAELQASQSGGNAFEYAGPSALKELQIMRDAGTLHNVPADTQKEILHRYRRAVYNRYCREHKTPAYANAAQRKEGLGSSEEWQSAMNSVAAKLPNDERERLEKAMQGILPPPYTPRLSPGLVSQWNFVTKLSAVESFWNIYGRSPAADTTAEQPGEQSLALGLRFWRRAAETGRLEKVKQELIDPVYERIASVVDSEQPVVWRHTLKSISTAQRWQDNAAACLEHLHAHGRYPSTGTAGRWIVRLRHKQNSLPIEVVVWLDSTLPGWDRFTRLVPGHYARKTTSR